MVEELIASIAEGSTTPQAAADEICSLLIEGLAADVDAGRLYLLWAAFSDWIDEFDDAVAVLLDAKGLTNPKIARPLRVA